MAKLGMALATGLAVKTADYPLVGRVQERPVMCYCGGVWVEHSPKRYEVIMIGVDEENARRNRKRNQTKQMVVPNWVYDDEFIGR